MAKYTRDTIDRALMHHQLAGAVRMYSPPEPPHENARRTWRISFAGAHVADPDLDVTPSTAHAVCVALAAAEVAYGNKPKGDVPYLALVYQAGVANVFDLADGKRHRLMQDAFILAERFCAGALRCGARVFICHTTESGDAAALYWYPGSGGPFEENQRPPVGGERPSAATWLSHHPVVTS